LDRFITYTSDRLLKIRTKHCQHYKHVFDREVFDVYYHNLMTDLSMFYVIKQPNISSLAVCNVFFFILCSERNRTVGLRQILVSKVLKFV